MTDTEPQAQFERLVMPHLDAAYNLAHDDCATATRSARCTDLAAKPYSEYHEAH